jgi:hypothetical protein
MQLPSHLRSSRGNKQATCMLIALLKRDNPSCARMLIDGGGGGDALPDDVRDIFVATLPAGANGTFSAPNALLAELPKEKKGWFSGWFGSSDDNDNASAGHAAAASSASTTANGAGGSSATGKPGGKVFGRAVADVCGDPDVSDADGIPRFLKVFCAFLLQPQHAQLVGLFRLSAQKEDVEALKKAVGGGGEKVADISAESPHTVAGVIKIFFREMPDPLLTFDRYEALIESHRKVCGDETRCA